MATPMLGRLPWRSAQRAYVAIPCLHQNLFPRYNSTSSGRIRNPDARASSRQAANIETQSSPPRRAAGSSSQSASTASNEAPSKASDIPGSTPESESRASHPEKPHAAFPSESITIRRVAAKYELSPRLSAAIEELEQKGYMNHMVQGRVPDLLSPDLHDEWAQFVERRTKVAESGPHMEDEHPRLPRNLLALYLQPLRKEAKYGIPTCDLQMRSYHAPNLLLFADFALRAAYYCGLPAFGPIPLPKMVERWTVPRAHYIHKKQQENFERITRRRLIQIKDGHPASVQLWLNFLKKHAVYGVGMKANVWEFGKLDVAAEMDESLGHVGDAWSRIGKDPNRSSDINENNIAELVNTRNRRRAYGLNKVVLEESQLDS